VVTAGGGDVQATSAPAGPGHYEQCPQDRALSTLYHSAEPDSLTAVLEVLVELAMVYGRDHYRRVLDELRQVFPHLDSGQPTPP